MFWQKCYFFTFFVFCKSFINAVVPKKVKISLFLGFWKSHKTCQKQVFSFFAIFCDFYFFYREYMIQNLKKCHFSTKKQKCKKSLFFWFFLKKTSKMKFYSKTSFFSLRNKWDFHLVRMVYFFQLLILFILCKKHETAQNIIVQKWIF